MRETKWKKHTVLQREKIGDLLWQSKSDAENLSTDTKQALDSFESEISKETDRVANESLQQVRSRIWSTKHFKVNLSMLDKRTVTRGDFGQFFGTFKSGMLYRPQKLG